jgi:cellulose synthase/poly-beta-1,6-N-acetylglucosamine synthase-like glycosyltransferase
MVSPEAISVLVRHFHDERVAAVSGNVRVGNRRNILTNWQHVEYVTGFNVEKRAFGALDCVTVVPGAIGAWRKRAIVECGYFTDDTLAEDTDLTLQLLRRGYRVVVEEQAYAYTEAPETVRGFLKQRYRWTYGTLQCLWKHRRTLLGRKHKTLGYMALPNMLLFQFVLPVTAPFLDALAIIGIVSGDVKAALLCYSGFLLIDFLICLMAFRLEKLNLKPLLWLLLQRVVYRYLMAWIVWKSLRSALRGTQVGWNKLQRSGHVEVRDEVQQTG